MATFTIQAGHHFHRLWPVSFLPWLATQDRVTFQRRVKFDKSCVYDSPTYNAEDVNKLWGVSFGWLPTRVSEPIEPLPPLGDNPNRTRWVAPEHDNSARFGWVWSVSRQGWKQLAYCYANGVKNWDDQLRYPEVALVAEGQEVDEMIVYTQSTGKVEFYVSDAKNGWLLGSHTAQLPAGLPLRGWNLGFYFGGPLVSPHTMKAQIDRF